MVYRVEIERWDVPRYGECELNPEDRFLKAAVTERHDPGVRAGRATLRGVRAVRLGGRYAVLAASSLRLPLGCCFVMEVLGLGQPTGGSAHPAASSNAVRAARSAGRRSRARTRSIPGASSDGCWLRVSAMVRGGEALPGQSLFPAPAEPPYYRPRGGRRIP